MAKKIVTLIFLIISVIMLIYMFLSHYGILRYVKLHYQPLEYYSQNYTNLPKADKQRVVVVFSLDDIAKINQIKPFLNSVLDQTVRVDDIALILPQKYSGQAKKLDKKYNFLSVYFHSVEYGDSAGLVTSVLQETESNTKILLVSSEMVYGKEFVQAMVESSNEKEDCVIYAKKDTLEKGVLVKPKFFSDKISQVDKREKCVDWLHHCTNAQIEICDYGETYKKM